MVTWQHEACRVERHGRTLALGRGGLGRGMAGRMDLAWTMAQAATGSNKHLDGEFMSMITMGGGVEGER